MWRVCMQTLKSFLHVSLTRTTSHSVFSTAVLKPLREHVSLNRCYCVSVLLSQGHVLRSAVLTASARTPMLLSVIKYYQNLKFHQHVNSRVLILDFQVLNQHLPWDTAEDVYLFRYREIMFSLLPLWDFIQWRGAKPNIWCCLHCQGFWRSVIFGHQIRPCLLPDTHVRPCDL